MWSSTVTAELCQLISNTLSSMMSAFSTRNRSRIAGYGFLGLIGGRPDVMCSVEMVLLANFVAEFTCGGSRFARINVQPGAHASCLHCLYQSGLVHYVATRGVD